MAQPEQAEEALKVERVLKALAEQDVQPPAAGPSWLEHPGPLGYRRRIRLRLVNGLPTFFNPEKENDCAVLTSELRRLLDELRGFGRLHPETLKHFEHLELRQPDVLGRGAITLHRRSEAPHMEGESLEDHLARATERIGRELGILSYHSGQLLVPAQLVNVTAEVNASVPVNAFLQVNEKVNALLVDRVREFFERERLVSLLDLYCGSGNFTLPLMQDLLRRTAPIEPAKSMGVEFSPHAVAALENQALQNLGPAAQAVELSFVAGDALATATKLVSEGARFDLVLANPPRAGLKGRVEPLTQLASSAIVLCHCSEKSFARDARALSDYGFLLRDLYVANMFPKTAHAEVLGFFSKQ